MRLLIPVHLQKYLSVKLLNRLIVAALVGSIVMMPFGILAILIWMIPLIGTPLFYILISLPSIFLLLLAARMAIEFFASMRRRKALFACFCAAGLLAIGLIVFVAPYLANRRFDTDAANVLAEDIEREPRASAGGSVALLDFDRDYARGDRCDRLCERLLLSGAAKRVLVASITPASKFPDNGQVELQNGYPSMKVYEGLRGRVYSIERHEACQQRPLPDTSDHFNIPEDRRKDGKPFDSRALFAARGECLSETSGVVGDFEVVWLTGVIRSAFAGDAFPNIFADGLSARRAEFHERRDGRFELVSRRTTASYSKHPPVLTISIFPYGHTPIFVPNFYRFDVERGSRETIEDFIQRGLGWRIALDAP